jgi:hypothetical protein
MELSLRRRTLGAAASLVFRPLLAAVSVLALAGCGLDGQPSPDAAQPRGATVAFESIDGPPSAQFHRLVQDLNGQAQMRQLAVVSRDQPSVYRVRGYLAAEDAKDVTTVSWVWDVFDSDQHRALRIAGTETAKGRRRGWNAADDAMLKHIASSSMDQLAVFLTSPEATPGTPATAPAQVASIGRNDTTPESVGIYRLFKPDADPLQAATEQVPAASQPPGAITGQVPLPRSRPSLPVAVSANETITLAAADTTRR